MQAPAELRSVPQVFAEALSKRTLEYESVLRKMHWSEGPVWILAGGSQLAAGLTARYAFEALLGWPAIVREFLPFLAYSVRALRTGCTVLVIDSPGDTGPAVEAAEAARKRGAQVLAITSQVDDPLALQANQTFLLPRAAESWDRGLAEAFLEHGLLSYLALLAARLFKRPDPALEKLEREWAELPRQFESIVNQLGDAVTSLVRELESFGRVVIVGGGSYHPAAVRAAMLSRRTSPKGISGFELGEFRSQWLSSLDRETAVLVLGGSRCRVKRALGELSTDLRKRGATGFAVTDHNDHDLIRQARMALLMPDVTELPGSLLALALAGWTACALADRRRAGKARRAAGHSDEDRA